MAPRCWWTSDLAADGSPSFARRTILERIPKILDATVAQNPQLPPDALTACAALRAELAGPPWTAMPWYVAEVTFYQRLLDATGYGGTGAGMNRDPFLPAKRIEEATLKARVQTFQTELCALQQQGDDPLPALLLASLWGNRADLSYAVGRDHGDHGHATDLLVDDRSAIVTALERATAVAIVLDNAGTELAFDLLLAAELRHRGMEVTLYAKDHPFFVSDATIVDVKRTEDLLQTPRFCVRDPPFFTSTEFYLPARMPPALVEELCAFDLVIFKGDANYRRLVGDAPWPHDTPFADVVTLPFPLAALRTFKAEVAVGLDLPTVARARALDPRWLVSGRFGMVQARLS